MTTKSEQKDKLYYESLKGLAESKLAGKTNRAVDEDLKRISEEFKCAVKTVEKDYRDILAQVQKAQNVKKREDIPKGMPLVPGAEERARKIVLCPDKVRVFLNDFRGTGMLVDSKVALFLMLIVGFQFVNLRSMARIRKSSIKGVIVVFWAESGEGKTELLDHTLEFIQPALLIRISDCSDQFLVYSGGEDGRQLMYKVIRWDETAARRGVENYSTKQQIVWQTTSAGFYTRGTTEENKDGQRVPRMVTIEGPITHLFSTVDSPRKFDDQFRNRAYWLNVDNSKEQLLRIQNYKVRRETDKGLPERQLIWQAWQLVPKVGDDLAKENPARFRSLDPENPEASADVDTPYLDDAEANDSARGDLRRTDLLHALLYSHTVLHQAHRKRYQRPDGRWVLVSSEADYNAVIPIFEMTSLAEHSVSVPASKQAFLKIASFLDSNSERTVEDIQVELGKSTRTVWSYIADWKALSLITATTSGGKTVVKLGPAVTKLVDSLMNPEDYADTGEMRKARSLFVGEAAKHLLNNPGGFRPEQIPVSFAPEPCQCELHHADVQIVCNEVAALPETSQLLEIAPIVQSMPEEASPLPESFQEKIRSRGNAAK